MCEPMQPLVLPVRAAVTADQVVDLVRDAPAVTDVAGGCELLAGPSLVLAEDLSSDLVAGSVSRAGYARLHGTAEVVLTRELLWTSAIVRPYITLSDGAVSARFNLGAYYTATPSTDVGAVPVEYRVQCYDILSILDDPVGDSFAVAAGTRYVEAVEQILVQRGVVAYAIDPLRADAVLPADRVWPFNVDATWLTIVNDLLGAIGYQGIFSDWDGVLWAVPYRSPRDRSPEWTYDAQPLTSMLGPRSLLRDNYGVPNRWVGYQTNNTDETDPVEGDGRFTYVNELIGPTSVAERGRTITKRVPLDVADQAALEAATMSVVDADMLVPAKLAVVTFPNPLHWHFDVIRLEDAELGVPSLALVTRWTLPLSNDEMTHEWTLIE